VVNGFGYYRVVTEYAHERTFNQEIAVRRIGNPLSVLLDPNAQEADASDARFAFIVDEMPKKEFKKKFPNAKFTDFDTDGNKYSQNWIIGENVRYVEYFYKEYEDTEMHLLADGTTVSDEEYQESVKELGAELVPPIEETRTIPQAKVKWCRLSGAEVLEEKEWLGKYIPIIRVVGNEYNIDGKVMFSGLIRAAKDPQRLYNYSRSAFAERVALTPKSPWLVAEGQLEGHEEEWEQAHVEPAVLTYKETSLDGHPVPPPQRVGATDIPEGFARDMQLSEHDIQASMGMYAASIGQAGNERSGKAIQARQREGDTATFHYQDNASRGIRYLGMILVDLIPKVYDSKRVLRLLGEDGTPSSAELNPDQDEAVMKMGSKMIYNLNVGTYDVSVAAGPSFTTRRVEQSEAMMELIHNSPEVLTIAGDLLVKSQDWPGAQELAERFRIMLPPPIQQALSAKETEHLPPEAQAMMVQAQKAIEERDMQLQQISDEFNKARSEYEKTKIDLAAMKAEQRVSNDMNNVEKSAAELQATEKLLDERLKVAELEFELKEEKLINAMEKIQTDTIMKIKDMLDSQKPVESEEAEQPPQGPNPDLMAILEHFQNQSAAMLEEIKRPRTKTATFSDGRQATVVES
jgi:hypothetical protein